MECKTEKHFVQRVLSVFILLSMDNIVISRKLDKLFMHHRGKEKLKKDLRTLY